MISGRQAQKFLKKLYPRYRFYLKGLATQPGAKDASH
jgi:hypothetical protein